MAKPGRIDEDSEALRSDDIFQLMSDVKAFESIQLKAFKLVQEYSKVFCDLDREISSAARQITPEPILIAKYLNGLGQEYKEFVYRFTLSQACFFDERHAPHVMLEDAIWDALAAEHSMSGLRNPLEEFAEHILEKETLVSSIMGERFQNVQSNHCEYCKTEGHVEAKCFKKYPYLRPPNISQQRTVTNLEQKPSRTCVERTLAKANAEAFLGTSKALQICPSLTMPTIFKDNKVDPDFLTEWIIDSSASHHLCWDRTKFNTIEPYWKVGAVTGPPPNIAGYCPEGYGTLNLLCIVKGQPKFILLTDVLLCPELPANFLSMKQLKSHGAFSSIPPDQLSKNPKNSKNAQKPQNREKPFQNPKKAQKPQKAKEGPKLLMIYDEEVVLTGSKKKGLYTANLRKESITPLSRVIKL